MYRDMLTDDLLQEQEYMCREFYYVIDFTGRMYSNVLTPELRDEYSISDVVFNPRTLVCTMNDFDRILDGLYSLGNGDFKIIGTHKYESLNELNKIWI